MSAANYGSIHLQGIGSFRAIPAGDLKVGDVTIWNFGGLQTVAEIKPAGVKSVAIVWRDKDGKTYPARRYLATRLIGFPRQPGEVK